MRYLGRQVAQQGGFTDTRLSHNNQQASSSGARLLHQGGKLRTFPLATV